MDYFTVPVIFVLLGVIWSMRQDLRKKAEVIDWCDEREIMFRPLVAEIQRFRTVSWTSGHYGAIDGFWREGRFGPNGPREFVPSGRGIEQIQLAMQILKDREVAMKQAREGILRAYGNLANWEITHPVPDYGIPEPPARKNSVLRALNDRHWPTRQGAA